MGFSIALFIGGSLLVLRLFVPTWVIVLIVGLAGCGYYYYTKNQIDAAQAIEKQGN